MRCIFAGIQLGKLVPSWAWTVDPSMDWIGQDCIGLDWIGFDEMTVTSFLNY